MTAAPLVHGVEAGPADTIGAHLIDAAVRQACATPGAQLDLDLRTLDARAAELSVTPDQVRALAAADASLAITVVLEGSS